MMSKRMMVLRLPDWIEQLMCFAFRSARVLSWIRRNCQVRRREFFKVCMRVRSQRALIKTVDQSTGEVLFAVGCRDDLPILDSGSVVSTCPVDYATSVPTEKVHYSTNLESVLGESLQHDGIKRYVLFANRTGSTMNVNFEVTDTERAILLVHKGCGNGSMIVFALDGKGQIVNDTKCIEQVKQIMENSPGFDIVYDRGAYVLDVDVNDRVYANDQRRKFESDSGISFSVLHKEYWERALNQAQQDHERRGINSTGRPW